MDKFATAISCMDGRIQLPVITYMKNKYNVDYVDMITVPGVDKVLADNVDTTAIASIKKCVNISVALKGSRHIAVTGHYDCAGNPADRKAHIEHITAAVELIRRWGFDAQVTGLWVNKDWQIEEII